VAADQLLEAALQQEEVLLHEAALFLLVVAERLLEVVL
jgi:hypothetical protein